MSMGEPRYVDVNGIRTRYFEAGDRSAPTMLLIHGGSYDYRLGIAADDWAANFELFATRFRVIAVDKLGAGESDGPPDDSGYTMQAVIDHLKELTRVLGLERYVLVGHSRGALPAARIAVDEPGSVPALVIFNSNTLAPDDPVVPSEGYFPEGTLVPTESLVRNRLGQAFYTVESPTAQDYMARKAAWCNAAAPQHPDRPMENDAIRRVLMLEQRYFRPDLARVKKETLELIRLDGFAQPVLVFWGMHDVSAPFKIGIDLYTLIGAHSVRAELHAVSAGRHLVHVEHPGIVDSVIAEFWSRTSSGQRPDPSAGPSTGSPSMQRLRMGAGQ